MRTASSAAAEKGSNRSSVILQDPGESKQIVSELTPALCEHILKLGAIAQDIRERAASTPSL